MTDLKQRAQELQLEFQRKLIELGADADAQEKIIFVNIKGDYMCPTGSVGANVVTECEITVEDI